MLLKVKEVAAELGYSVKYVWGLIKKGQLRAVKFGRQWRVDKDDLDLFIYRRKV